MFEINLIEQANKKMYVKNVQTSLDNDLGKISITWNWPDDTDYHSIIIVALDSETASIKDLLTDNKLDDKSCVLKHKLGRSEYVTNLSREGKTYKLYPAFKLNQNRLNVVFQNEDNFTGVVMKSESIEFIIKGTTQKRWPQKITIETKSPIHIPNDIFYYIVRNKDREVKYPLDINLMNSGAYGNLYLNKDEEIFIKVKEKYKKSITVKEIRE